MSAFDWFLIAWWALGVVLTAMLVGKPRKPINGTQAAIIVVINFAFIAGLLVSRGVIA